MAFEFQPFSRKQRQLLHWWRAGSGVEDRRMVLADGAIRSGKTVAMILSFLMWSLTVFSGRDFILAGVTSGALRRNVLMPMFSMLEALRIPYEWKRGEGRVSIGQNRYYLFGADKDNAQDKLQGMTAAGAYADEAALFPRSFIDQMIGRCSVQGSRIFMNCNPNGAYHYIKTDFIDRAEEIGLYRLHFTMDDNLTLSPEIRESYARSFAGVFYRRFILGEWVSAEGAVYPMWDDSANTFSLEEADPEAFLPENMRRFCAVDYGTANPCVFLDVRDDGRTFWIMNEYYWDSAARRKQKTDAEYADDLAAFLGGDRNTQVIVDPSAASLKAELRGRGYRILDARNNVREGIATTAVLIGSRRIRAERNRCPCLLREIHGYLWDEKARARGEERPVKDHDHAMDALRYLCHTRAGGLRRAPAPA